MDTEHARLGRDDYPAIIEHRYHYNGILFSVSQKELDSVAERISKTVPTKHPDYALLQEVGQRRKAEIETK